MAGQHSDTLGHVSYPLSNASDRMS